MDRRAFLKAGALMVATLPLAAYMEQEIPDPVAPVHIQNDDPGWAVLNGAKLDIDAERGLMTAAFTPEIRAFEGKPFRIGGFMLPLDARTSFTHFVLTRRNTTCSFCPPNELTEAIEIFSLSELTFTADEYVVSGIFETIADSAEGLFYRLRDARVERLL